ncbi:hypothetical protein BKA58DRAFT_443632 [Alternaria rosae]|uniref:uncharacterized protein n=1 Tax=Alternaria rosae TaxID=1187941 RepID=UPI001E8D94E3|nr:uncharacterized protein BKA58DRAFT_443632 [Alternaria rosae]KAH6860852.1 hypothetical protein BKA58DRAFT_443632 [Alternaria rosae]
MSTPRPEVRPDQEVAGKHEVDPASSSVAEPEAAEHDDITSDGAAPADVEGQQSATDELREVLRLLKSPPGGNHTRGLCDDGVVRYMVCLPTPDDEVTRIGVYDAQPLSPRMIKRWLDRKP